MSKTRMINAVDVKAKKFRVVPCVGTRIFYRVQCKTLFRWWYISKVSYVGEYLWGTSEIQVSFDTIKDARKYLMKNFGKHIDIVVWDGGE